MGPEYGTPEYEEQRDMIVAQLSNVPMEPNELDRFIMLYIMDRTISRAAISEAHKILTRKLKK